MRKKYKIVIFPLVIFVLVLCFSLKSEARGVTSEEAGKYVAEFAINFFDAHANETYYKTASRELAYQGKKDSSGKYGFDCVGWLSFAVHQATGYGPNYYTAFAVPYHSNANGANSNPGFFQGYETVYGQGGSGKAIPIDELKQQLKPGDLLMKTAKHVLLYVGNGTMIHCTGHGPGQEYGGDSGFGIVKETIDHFYNAGYGIEAIGRLPEEKAATINESNLTTVFGESGKALTGKWQSASNNTSDGGWDNGTSTDGNSNSSTNYTSTQKVIEAGFQADYNLGLIYPKDNKNTPLNSFLDFTLPYLQTWMIPLAMNSGVMDTAGSSDKGKNPVFGYITLKEAMSDIIIDRYDITKCTLKTKYKVYDIIEYEVVTNSNGNKSRREIRRTHVDESENGPMSEEFVSKNFDVNTKYCIKKAHTFDVKIDNEYTYNKYSDSDVEQRINPKTETKEKGEAYSAGGDPGGDEEHTYWVRSGYYVNVTRTWEDEFEIGDSHVDTYDVEDVEDYINNFTLKKNNLSGNTNSSNGISTDGTIFNCTKYSLTEAQKQKLAKMVFAEFGASEEGAKAVASHMCNLYEYSVWAKITSKSFYDFIVNSKWFAAKTRSNQQYDDYSLQAVEQCIVNGQRTIAPYVIHYGGFAEMYQKFSGQIDYIKIDGKHGSNRQESRAIVEAAIPHQSIVRGSYSTAEGIFYKAIFASDGYNGTILFYNEAYKNACDSTYTTTETNTPSSSNSANVSANDLSGFLFIGDSLTVGLKNTNCLSEAYVNGVGGSSAWHWVEYLKGTKSKWNEMVDFTKLNMPDANSVKGISIMLGTNSLAATSNSGTVDSTLNSTKELIELIKQKYPNKPIYIESCLPVTTGTMTAKTNLSTYNNNLNSYNQQISKYASENGLNYIDVRNGYVGSDGKLDSSKSADGVHLKDYKTLETNIRNALAGASASSSSNSNNSSISQVQVDISGLEDFNYTDRDYYSLLKVDDAINRVDMANAKPENYLQYMRKGSQYSNHVGYSRGYLVYSYGELKRLFRKYFDDRSTLPFVYGSSLGYDTYTAERVLDAGTFEINGGSSTSGNGNGNDLVKVALEEVGYLEKKSNSQLDDKKANAGNNNYTKYGAWYGLNGGPNAPWCNIFVSWCADQLGLLDTVIPRSAGCSLTWSWFKSKGLTHLVTDTSYTPQPGDLVLRGPGDHIGIVEKFEDGVLYTIEGNTSGQGDVNEGNGVYEKKYPNPAASWYGYCSPEYPAASDGSVSGAVEIPSPYGTQYSFTWFNHIPRNGKGSWIGLQGQLIKDFGGSPSYPVQVGGDIKYDSNNMVKYGNWYAGAMVEFLGGHDLNSCLMHIEIGDLIFIIKEDGTYFPLIIQDIKAQKEFALDHNPANEWGHNNGACVVEFEIKYDSKNMGVYAKGRTAAVYKVGNVYNNKEYLYDLDKAVQAAGLDISKLVK